MTDTNVHDAWNTFWERQNRGGAKGGAKGNAKGSGCLPEGWQGIAERQRNVWHSFARTLPKNARVIDLATGDGAVLSNLLEVRKDLKLTGIDRATTLPDAPRGTKLKGGISMEDLPFADNHFAAATSQFGFEYGDIGKIAVELARVLRPGGRVGLLTHRLDGPIVAHNRKRREQIGWAIEEQELPMIARNSLALRKSGIATIPQAIMQAPEKGAAAHGPRSAAWEIAEAIRRTLHLGRNDSAENVSAILDDIEAQAKNELGRIASLEQAAATASDIERFQAVMTQAGFTGNGSAMVTDGRYPKPFADYRTYTLAA